MLIILAVVRMVLGVGLLGLALWVPASSEDR